VQTSVFEYMDYRRFLRDAYTELKRTKPQFSYRYFARRAGLGSPSYLKLVMDGDRNLSADMAGRFAQALRLDKQSAQFFCTLVALNQARRTDERAKHYEALSGMTQYRETKQLEPHQYNYYARWYCIPIRELAARDDFVEDPEWIAAQLRPAITRREAQQALDTLLALGMLRRGDQGRLVQSEALISTGPELRTLSLRRFHQQMLEHAGTAMDEVPIDEREVGGVTVRLTATQVDHLKRRLYEIRQEVLQLEDSASSSEPEAVYHFALQLFPVTRAG
jgi:uncharacterized protein (TIGR02147 family)